MDSSRIEFHQRHVPPGEFPNYVGGSRIAEYLIIRGTPYIFLEDCAKNTLNAYNASTWQCVKIITVPRRIQLCKVLHNFYTADLQEFYLLSGNSEIVHFSDLDTIIEIIDLNEKQFSSPYDMDHFLVDHNVPRLTGDSMFLFQVESGKKVKTATARKRPFPTAALEWQNRRIHYIGDRKTPHWSEAHYGLMDIRYQYFSDSTILYANAFNAEITQFAIETAESEYFICKSRYDTLATPPISLKSTRDAKWKHMMTHGYYGRIVHNPWERCYYRFYYLPIPEKMPNGDYATMTDRRLSVMILTEDFKLADERMLPSSCHFLYFASPLPEGLVINHGPVVQLDMQGLNLLEIRH